MMSFSGLHVFMIGLLICFVPVQAEETSLSPDNVRWKTVPRTEAEACFAYNSTTVEEGTFCLKIKTETREGRIYNCKGFRCQSISVKAREPAIPLFSVSTGSENRLSGASTAALLFSVLLASPDMFIEKGFMVLVVAGVSTLILTVLAPLLESLLMPYVTAAGAYFYSSQGLIIVVGGAIALTTLAAALIYAGINSL